jgi:hypothetical protein
MVVVMAVAVGTEVMEGSREAEGPCRTALKREMWREGCTTRLSLAEFGGE